VKAELTLPIFPRSAEYQSAGSKERRIPLPSLPGQESIFASLDAKLKLLGGLRLLNEEAKRSIQQTLNRIWEN
jgi:hypothetical protein